jgi:UDP-N-acetylmuramate dehydrogenase
LKGVEHKGLKISSKHANFIENLGGATKNSYIELVKKINSEVERKNGYRFETEVIIFR